MKYGDFTWILCGFSADFVGGFQPHAVQWGFHNTQYFQELQTLQLIVFMKPIEIYGQWQICDTLPSSSEDFFVYMKGIASILILILLNHYDERHELYTFYSLLELQKTVSNQKHAKSMRNYGS